MAIAIGAAGMIKKFVEDGAEKVSISDMRDFLKSVDADEKKKMGDDACELMGWTKTPDGEYETP